MYDEDIRVEYNNRLEVGGCQEKSITGIWWRMFVHSFCELCSSTFISKDSDPIDEDVEEEYMTNIEKNFVKGIEL